MIAAIALIIRRVRFSTAILPVSRRRLRQIRAGTLRAGLAGSEASVKEQLKTSLSCTDGEYAERIAAIHEWIRAGDVYQLNFTVPMEVHGKRKHGRNLSRLRSTPAGRIRRISPLPARPPHSFVFAGVILSRWIMLDRRAASPRGQ